MACESSEGTYPINVDMFTLTILTLSHSVAWQSVTTSFSNRQSQAHRMMGGRVSYRVCVRNIAIHNIHRLTMAGSGLDRITTVGK